MEREQKEAAGSITMDDGDAVMGEGGESSASIVNVCQRVKVQAQQQNSSNGNGNASGDASNPNNSLEEIWALIEFEEYNPDMPETALRPKRHRKWKRFDTESELSDFIRRDTGEPVTLPPFSLAPEQSARIQEKAKQEVSHITEEFRRFRVRSELARKQADAHIKELQSSHVQTAQRRIEGQDVVSRKKTCSLFRTTVRWRWHEMSCTDMSALKYNYACNSIQYAAGSTIRTGQVGTWTIG